MHVSQTFARLECGYKTLRTCFTQYLTITPPSVSKNGDISTSLPLRLQVPLYFMILLISLDVPPCPVRFPLLHPPPCSMWNVNFAAFLSAATAGCNSVTVHPENRTCCFSMYFGPEGIDNGLEWGGEKKASKMVNQIESAKWTLHKHTGKIENVARPSWLTKHIFCTLTGLKAWREGRLVLSDQLFWNANYWFLCSMLCLIHVCVNENRKVRIASTLMITLSPAEAKTKGREKGRVCSLKE